MLVRWCFILRYFNGPGADLQTKAGHVCKHREKGESNVHTHTPSASSLTWQSGRSQVSEQSCFELLPRPVWTTCWCEGRANTGLTSLPTSYSVGHGLPGHRKRCLLCGCKQLFLLCSGQGKSNTDNPIENGTRSTKGTMNNHTLDHSSLFFIQQTLIIQPLPCTGFSIWIKAPQNPQTLQRTSHWLSTFT